MLTSSPIFPEINYGSRLRAGVLVPSGNSVAEPELRAMLPPEVSLLVTRLSLRGSSQPELMRMLDQLEAASTLLADAEVEVIVFHCTAVSTFAPDMAEAIQERIKKATGKKCFTTADAILAALSKLSARRVSLLTPYIDEVHRREVEFLQACGFEVVGGANLGIDTNAQMSQLEPKAILDWAQRNIGDASDVCFLSCTAIKSASIISALEKSSGKPVITSNQCMIWHLLRSSNVAGAAAGFGMLFGAPKQPSVTSSTGR
jgi:maleate isomerase